MDSATVDKQIDILMRETFELIPDLFPSDLEMQKQIQAKIPIMVAYTRKMWVALGARSIADYTTLTQALGNAYVTSNAKSVLACTSMVELSQRMAAWVQANLEIEFTNEDLLARGTLEVVAAKTAALVNDKMGKLRNAR
jgi:hypothetical protein